MKAAQSAITNRKSPMVQSPMAPRPWTASELRRLRRLYADSGSRELALILGRTRVSVASKAKMLHLRRNGDYQSWSEREIAELRRLYPDTPMPRLARHFGRSIRKIYQAAERYGVSKSAAFMAALYAIEARKLANPGVNHRFKPGQVPANKGLRRPGYAPGRMAETQFKMGELPHNHLPVGTIQPNADGYLRMKVADVPKNGAGANDKNWVFVHKAVWEKAHGPIPKGYRIWWKDRDHMNCALENLELLGPRDHMMQTSIHTLLPKPLAELMQLHNVLKRMIHKREKQSEIRRSARNDRRLTNAEKQDGGSTQSFV